MDPGRRPPRLAKPRRLVPPPTELSVHFEGLAHPTRLTIVERLAGAAEVRVSELAELCKVSQPRMSWHLRILRRSQVIRTRREGREVFCRLDREAIAAHMRSFMRLMLVKGPEGELSPDLVQTQLTGEPAQ
ncbi:MAG TPA: metalloregulator ArsR/SmtB family transcription factor [Candidatus Dormibacteraeota bacterium]|jgi:ArsR family transcriptional regulator|nr:metalloregulator ArsR/SmtB family transcription factor [Candidatus Dormibacteraeota bacterium]